MSDESKALPDIKMCACESSQISEYGDERHHVSRRATKPRHRLWPQSYVVIPSQWQSGVSYASIMQRMLA